MYLTDGVNIKYQTNQVYPWNMMVQTGTTIKDFTINTPVSYGGMKADLIIADDCVVQQKEETPMKKYFTHSGSGTKYDTREEAEKSAKKYMESMSKAYGTNHDVYILEAIACITFPLPAYEVVSLAAKA